VPDQGADRQGVQLQVPLPRHLQDAEHGQGMPAEVVVRRAQQLAICQHEAVLQQRRVRGAGAQRGRAKGRADDGRLQHGRDARDLTRRQEVVPHEALHPVLPSMARVAHARADHGLQVERQPVLSPARDVVQVEAHGPQEVP